MANAIVPLNQEESIASVKLLANIVHALYEDVFKPKLDYGVIPGTGDKPVLLLPGMEKLMRALHLRAEYVPRQQVIDFDKPLFFFQYECRLIDIDSGLTVSTAVGSANSHESKWRWRNAQRVCPTCGKAAIIEGKAEYGGGWVCFKKKDGCGAKFAADDVRITGQQVGKVENPDIADQLNTIDKIAQKRALSSAIKGAANVSELFTVDLDDLTDYVVTNGNSPQTPALADGAIEGTFEIEPPRKATPKAAPAPAANGWTQQDRANISTELKALNVSVEEMLTVLSVEKLSDYAPGYSAASEQLKAFAMARSANGAPLPADLFGGNGGAA